jgi:hypothetical protein
LGIVRLAVNLLPAWNKQLHLERLDAGMLAALFT